MIQETNNQNLISDLNAFKQKCDDVDALLRGQLPPFERQQIHNTLQGIETWSSSATTDDEDFSEIFQGYSAQLDGYLS